MTPPPYRLTVYSLEGGPVRSSCGVQMVSEPLPAKLKLDTLIVSGGEGTRRMISDEAFLSAVKDLSSRTRRTCSVCSGSFVLASAGLLKGRRATTHWRRSSAFERYFPETALDADRIFVRDGKFWTSAGITAGIDLALALVEDDPGDVAARQAARELVIHQRRQGGQSQFSVMQDVKLASGRFDTLIGWIQTNLSCDLSVETRGACSDEPAQFRARVPGGDGRDTGAVCREVAAGSGPRCGGTNIVGAAGYRPDGGSGDPERMRVAFMRAYGQPPMVLRRQSRGQAPV